MHFFTTKKIYMKQRITHSMLLRLMPLLFVIVSVTSCQKEQKPLLTEKEQAPEMVANANGHLKQTKTFSSDVIVRWLNMQLKMLQVPFPPGTGLQAADRAMGYCGIAVYEAVVPGMPAYQTLQGQLVQFPEMPDRENGKAYHWGAAANAALAQMNRKLFPAASAANKTAIDELENSLLTNFATEVNAETLQRSVDFGKEVAARVFAWAATDGSANVNPPYVPPVGPGLWASTPPNFPAAINPYLFQRRYMVAGVTNGAVIAPPPAYSTDPASPFYAMVKDVYDKSLVLTPEQTAMAIYHRDAPGYPGGGQMVAILSQVIAKADVKLDVAALAYAKAGIAMYDATNILFTQKYSVNLVRPITYIRNVMGYSTWLGLFNTPGHPEFPSGHAMISATIGTALADVFGENFEFDNRVYDYLNLPARHYNSFKEMAKEMADSRVYAGIHYQATCDKSIWLGEKVTTNVLNTVKFLKEDE
jgi:membrane-associated phospholipid phosphatase